MSAEQEKDSGQIIAEQLSALADDELAPEELELLVRRLERSEERRAELARYMLIGSVMRGEPRQAHQLHSKVRQALDGLADVSQPVVLSTRFGRSKIAVGVAAVASVAVVMVGLQLQQDAPLEGVPAIAAVADSVISSAAQSAATVASVAAKQAAPGQQMPNRMASYLIAHDNHARTFSLAVMDSGFAVQQASFER